MEKRKIGRNEPCPCGSGLKYKKCHGSISSERHYQNKAVEPTPIKRLPPDFQKKIIEHQIKEKRVKEQYGNTRPIISEDFKDYKFVAVGNKLHYSKNWKTFHDFLFDYIKTCIGSDWGNAELKKENSERHPILQWYKYLCDFQRKNIRKEGEIHSAICTGPVGAYLSLAYDLYVLRHNSLLQDRLIARLKEKNQFQGARYEIYVTSSFVKAGFDIEFEDETDKTKSHCEFIATHKKSGKKYSVEAKSRHRPGLLGQSGNLQSPDEIRLRIGGLLRDALKKEASNARIVFIDINMPPEEGGTFDKSWFNNLMTEVSKVEKDEMNGVPFPSAYLIFTNHPYHYVGEEEPEPQRNFLMTAINIPHFKMNNTQIAQMSEPTIFLLWESINVHSKVPNDFNE